MAGDRDRSETSDGARRDLNGRPVVPGRWDRVRNLFRHGAVDDPLDCADTTLVVVAESGDEAAASSAVLATSAWRADEEVVLRHVLQLPAQRVSDAVATAALSGYRRLDSGPDAGPDVADANTADPTVTVLLARVQMLDAVHLSQERSRMASLGSRHGGLVVGWQVLQRPVGDR